MSELRRWQRSLGTVFSQGWLGAIMCQIYFQSNLNLFSAGSSIQTLIQGIIICFAQINREIVKSWMAILDSKWICSVNLAKEA